MLPIFNKNINIIEVKYEGGRGCHKYYGTGQIGEMGVTKYEIDCGTNE